MSYKTFIDYGYGVCFDNYKETSLPDLLKLIAMAPVLNEKIQKFIEENCEGNITDTEAILDDYVQSYGHVNYGGIADIMCEVIMEVEDIELLVCTDFDGKEYLIYPPLYPWTLANLSEKEKSLTIDSLREIFVKYMSVITTEEIKTDYQEVENGG